MAYPVMDDCLAFRFRKVVRYSTSIVAGSGGQEDRDANWTTARRQWALETGGRLSDDLIQDLEMLFHETRGAHLAFLFKDKRDFHHWQVSTNQSAIQIGTGDGTTAEFPVVKLYGSGANQRSRDVIPISGTLNVYVGAVLKTENTDYTVDYDTGIITFTGGSPTVVPGNGVPVTAEYQFRTLVRFASDDLDIDALTNHARYLTSAFELVEVRS